MTQKMTITADDDKFDDIMKQVVSVCKKVEPDCQIVLYWRSKKMTAQYNVMRTAA